MKLLLENVRGFAGKHQLNVKPLTILLGENSSGKTTLLSSIFVALQGDFPTADAFNRTPFELGSFDTISTYRGGKYGRSPTFTIGWEEDRKEKYSLSATFSGRLGIPRLHSILFVRGARKLYCEMGGDKWIYREDDDQSLEFDPPNNDHPTPPLHLLLQRVFEYREKIRSQDQDRHARFGDLMFELVGVGPGGRPRVIALAPLRTRPHRTYDELIEEFKPEGDHVPLVLARALNSEEPRDRALAAALDSFGRASGLFSALKVRRMGRSPSDPFQLRVKSAGPDANLVDVGYGVSQALPVVVDSYLAPKGSAVLIQQPEVHLHPRAQAALGTFFCELVKSGSKRLVIETHSDFLVDRVRMAVASGVISHDDVNIAFLERHGLDVRLHELHLDELGNITNAPESYRAFFLQEQMNLMFRGE